MKLHKKAIIALVIPILAISNSALASPVVIDQVQAQGKSATGSAVSAEEFISVYNNTDTQIDVTDWCVYYASSSDATQTKLACFLAPDSTTRLMLGAHASATLATSEFKTAHSSFVSDLQFSNAISSSAGHIRLFDAQKNEVDRLGFGSALHPELSAAPAATLGKVLQRKTLNNTRQDTDNNALDFEEAPLLLPTEGGLKEVISTVDYCANLEGVQDKIPEGYEQLDGENCTPIYRESAALIITELLPNATSYDTGNEFIEIYNPNERAVSLGGYSLQLGPSFSSGRTLPDELLAPFSYISFSDMLSGLVLPNTSGSVRLVAPAGNTVSQTDLYVSPSENSAWALINDIWQYTNRPTPGASNLLSLLDNEADVIQADMLDPCPEGKYRNPDTNRCRAIETGDTELRPCDSGQTRNPETNRCRGSAADGGLTPCKDGQERNPETNRCRSAVVASSTLKPCDAGEERNPDTNRCRKTDGSVAGLSTVKDVQSPISGSPKWWLAGASFVAALGYAVYEWRSDLLKQLLRFKQLWARG